MRKDCKEKQREDRKEKKKKEHKRKGEQEKGLARKSRTTRPNDERARANKRTTSCEGGIGPITRLGLVID